MARHLRAWPCACQIHGSALVAELTTVAVLKLTHVVRLAEKGGKTVEIDPESGQSVPSRMVWTGVFAVASS